ncbi:MAG: sporulation protein YabP, partial [Clostridium celatum]|nr:sporulation protein YabP [Clostridium celatum]
ENRQKMTLTGVLEVISFDDEKIFLNTKLGNLTIKGSDLKMNKLDVQNGDIIIMGNISYIVYSGKDIKKEKQSLIEKLFK